MQAACHDPGDTIIALCTEDLPVVLVSAKEGISPEVKAQAQAVVRKPFDVDDLLAVVRRLLSPPLKT
jgi:CheY-like chemotaxis protein